MHYQSSTYIAVMVNDGDGTWVGLDLFHYSQIDLLPAKRLFLSFIYRHYAREQCKCTQGNLEGENLFYICYSQGNTSYLDSFS